MPWGIDFGTTNTRVARWDPTAGAPTILRLPRSSRSAEEADPMFAGSAVPPAVLLREELDLWTRLSMRPALRGRVRFGRWADIGRVAEDAGRDRPALAAGLKRWLSRAPLQTVARAGGRPVTAREASRVFLRELLLEAREVGGDAVAPLALSAPVGAFETYRAELRALTQELGVKKVRFVDEPVAAALGYGLRLSEARRVLVVDFGGGTLDLALVEFQPSAVARGSCEVLGKSGRELGGTDVDRWLLEELLDRADLPLTLDEAGDPGFWRTALLSDARALKEALYFEESGLFLAPGNGVGAMREVPYGRADLEALLERKGLAQVLAAVTSEALVDAGAEVDDVLMVGGSTLLPGVFSYFIDRFGRDRVRAWQPFEAVALGAAALAADAFEPADYIIHDYAIRMVDVQGRPTHEIIVPRGTRFPTPDDLWRRSVVPACARGEPERVFKLVICELGPEPGRDRAIAWDQTGRARLPDGARLVVPLNERDPAMGQLNPAHKPGDETARLEIGFGVSAERWLCATVKDLRNGRLLMKREPVVRLL